MPTGEATPREPGLARARRTDSDLLLGRGLPVPIPKPGGGRVSHGVVRQAVHELPKSRDWRNIEDTEGVFRDITKVVVRL